MICKEACWVLNNIAAGPHKQISWVLKDGNMLKVMELAMSAEWGVKKEALWAISNVAPVERTHM